jgi:hypothetical protein
MGNACLIKGLKARRALLVESGHALAMLGAGGIGKVGLAVWAAGLALFCVRPPVFPAETDCGAENGVTSRR